MENANGYWTVCGYDSDTMNLTLVLTDDDKHPVFATEQQANAWIESQQPRMESRNLCAVMVGASNGYAAAVEQLRRDGLDIPDFKSPHTFRLHDAGQ